MFVIILTLLLTSSQCLSIVELFGLEDKLKDMVKIDPTSHYGGYESIVYTLDPTIFTFLQHFKTRTELCDYKCP